jgi:hypothetical protein
VVISKFARDLAEEGYPSQCTRLRCGGTSPRAVEGPMKCVGLVMILVGITFCIVPSALAQYGAISDGSCRCKTLCDGGKSEFSPGHSVAQCRSMCARAYSGCSAGEIRSIQRRDLARAPQQRAAHSAATKVTAPSGAGHRIDCDRFGCRHKIISERPIAGRACQHVPRGIHLTGNGGINKTGWAYRPFYRCE